MTTEPSQPDPITSARQLVGGKNFSRRDTMEIVRALLARVETKETTSFVPSPSSTQMSPVTVTRTAQNAILIGPDANRCYTAPEAVAFTDKILAVVAEVSK